jgi:hypothetical protein
MVTRMMRHGAAMLLMLLRGARCRPGSSSGILSKSNSEPRRCAGYGGEFGLQFSAVSASGTCICKDNVLKYQGILWSNGSSRIIVAACYAVKKCYFSSRSLLCCNLKRSLPSIAAMHRKISNIIEARLKFELFLIIPCGLSSVSAWTLTTRVVSTTMSRAKPSICSEGCPLSLTMVRAQLRSTKYQHLQDCQRLSITSTAGPYDATVKVYSVAQLWQCLCLFFTSVSNHATAVVFTLPNKYMLILGGEFGPQMPVSLVPR